MIDATRLRHKIGELLADFYRRRQAKLAELKLQVVLRRKNPYLYRARGVKSAADIVNEMLEAFVTSSDEGIFGNCFFEPLAKWASQEAARAEGRGKQVSTSEAGGVDICIEDAICYVAVAVKSGTSVYTKQSRDRQAQEFLSLRKRVEKLQKRFEPIVGYGYGRKNPRPDTPTPFTELAGQVFWERLTGEADFYLRFMELMEGLPEHYVPAFKEELIKAENRLVKEFLEHFSDAGGNIAWAKLVQFNSGKENLSLRKRRG